MVHKRKRQLIHVAYDMKFECLMSPYKIKKKIENKKGIKTNLVKKRKRQLADLTMAVELLDSLLKPVMKNY